MRLTSSATVLSALLAGTGLALAPASAQNLVTNPGFETGDFTGWTTGGGVAIATASHTGNYATQFGGSLSQTIPTLAGENYAVSFFLNGDFQPSLYFNELTASFAGFQGEDITSAVNSSGVFSFYAQYSFTAMATGPTSVLQFTGISFPFTPLGSLPLYLDDVSVTAASPAAVPEASTTVSFGLLLVLGMGGMVIAARRKKASGSQA